MRRKLTVVWVMVTLLVLSGCPQDNAATTPVLTSVTPAQITAGSGDTNVTLKGSGFKKPIVVQWDNAMLLTTTLLSSSQVVATLPAGELQFPGTGTIRALQGGQGSQTATASLTITITNSTPTLTSITPAHATVNSPAQTITLVGTNFNTSSLASFGATQLATTFVSSTQLTAIIPATSLTTAGVDKVTVANGTAVSGSSNFTVVSQLAITTTTLPGGSVGVAYTATMLATGGTTPYNWSISVGTLPAGLTLNATTGVISGTPTAVVTDSFTVTCTDSSGTLAIRAFPVKK